MAKNKELYDALRDTDGLAGKDAAARTKALDELLKVDPTDATAFRKAIVDHGVFWSSCSAELMKTKMNVGWGIRAATADPGYFISDEFLDPAAANPFTELHRLAAEQRVTLGLKDASDEVLIGILKNNPDECRAYLADKQPELKQAHGWKPNEVIPAPAAPAPGAPPVAPEAPKNTSTDVLTDSALLNIQTAAVDLVLLRQIENSSKELVDNLLKATPATLKAAATALKMKQPVIDFLTYPLSDTVKAGITARILKLDQEDAASNVTKYIDKLTSPEILAYKTVLEDPDISVFKAKLDEPYKSKLMDPVLTKAKSQVSVRYLESFLPTLAVNLLPALNAADVDALKIELKKNPSIAHPIIDTAVTEENMDKIRHAMVQGLIKNLKDNSEGALIALDKAASLALFRAELTKLGITKPDWVKDSDMGSMKEWARTRAFEIQVNKASRFTTGAHPELIKALTQLPVVKQRELLEKPENLRILLNAKDVNQVEHYFGHNTDAAALIDENKVLEPFKKIHNAEVARVLASIEPPITLSQAQIDAINKAFVTAGVPPVYNLMTLNNPADYKTLIDVIKNQTGIVNDAAFYNAFGLDDAGTAITTPAIRDAIRDQHAHNQHLLTAYHAPATTDVNKKILDVFLSESKTAPVTIADKDAVVASINYDKLPIVQRPQAAPALTPIQKSIKTNVKSELSPLMGAKIKQETKAQLGDANVDVVKLGLAKLTTGLDLLQKEHKSLTENAQKLEKIANIEDIHLMNPAFQGKAKSKSVEMLTHFKELAEDCDLIVDQLRRQKATLEGHYNSLPTQRSEIKVPPQDQGLIINSIRDLKYELNIEWRAVKKDLAFYEKIQEKLYGDKSKKEQGLLEVIENAAQGKNNYIYKADDVTTYIEGKEAEKVGAPAVPLAAMDVGVNGETLPFLLGESLSAGQVRVYDFKQQSVEAPAVEYKGKFTEEHSVTGNQVHSGTFKVKEFPKEPQPLPGRRQVTPEQLKEFEKAKVAFSLAMAVQTLASMDGKPTKDNQVRLRGNDEEMLKYLYAALITLGVDKNAIKVRSKAFDPEKDKGWFGLPSDSDVTKVFKDKTHSAAVKDSKEDLQQLMDLKSDKTGTRKKVDSSVAEATRMFKKENIEIIEKAKKELKEEGPAPRGPK